MRLLTHNVWRHELFSSSGRIFCENPKRNMWSQLSVESQECWSKIAARAALAHRPPCFALVNISEIILGCHSCCHERLNTESYNHLFSSESTGVNQSYQWRITSSIQRHSLVLHKCCHLFHSLAKKPMRSKSFVCTKGDPPKTHWISLSHVSSLPSALELRPAAELCCDGAELFLPGYSLHCCCKQKVPKKYISFWKWELTLRKV